MRKRPMPVLIPAVTTRGRAGLLRTTALQAAALLVFATPLAIQAANAQPAPNARPTGGVVVGGAASIGQTSTTTTINQSSQRAAIDWRSFDVGANQSVQFQQPGTTAVTLNRVTGPDPSQIAGRIQANGQIVITNQSGVTFYKGAQVDAAGLIVSAAGISTPNFMAGRMVFDQAPKPDAMVSNAGTITIKEAGLAALVAPRVANSGVINAQMGRVVLAGAETHTIDLYGDGLLSIDITGQVRQAPRGADGKPVTALVTNTGTIIADGGSITLTAAAADGIVQNLVQAGGRLQANAADGHAGTVVVAGVGGSVSIEGRIAADGKAPGSTGGTITATASNAVTIAAPARITANGAAGGGRITIGNRATTKTVTVEAGATIAANARKTGNGGTVAILSGGTTTFNGAVFARGGRESGNGGNVEVSGNTLALAGTINTAAPAGQVGKILLDPTDVTISDHGGAGTVVTPASLQAMTGNVTVQADNSVVASSSVALTGTNQSLTLNGGSFVRVDAGITLSATGSITLAAGAGGVSLLGSLTTGNATGLVFNTTGAVTQGAASAITTAAVSGTVGSAALTSRLNLIASDALPNGFTAGSFTASVGDISIVTASPNFTLQTGYFANGIIVPNGRTISITADSISLQGINNYYAAYAPGGTIALQTFTAGRPIEITTAYSEGASAFSNGFPDGVLSLKRENFGLLGAPTLSIGVTGGGPINVGADGQTTDFGALGITRLVLRSGGDITQGTGGGTDGAIAVTTLDAVGFNINLPSGDNFIPNITQYAASNDAILHAGDTLNVNGPVTGFEKVFLSTSGSNGPTMVLNSTIRGGTIDLDAFDGNSLATSGGIVQNAGSTINAATLVGRAGSASFTQGNFVTVGDFHTGGNFTFNGASSVFLNSTLQSDAGVVTLTSPGPITQAATGTLLTPTLSGSGSSASFLSPTNLVGTLQGFTTTTGGIALSTTLAPPVLVGVAAAAAAPPGTPLALAGANAVATGQTLAIIADRVTTAAGATLSAPGGTISFTPLTTGRGAELVATTQSTAALSLNQNDLSRIQTGTLQIGAATGGPILIGQAGDAVSLAGRATTLSLLSSGAITAGTGATITVPTITASAASIALPGANGIGTIGAITTSTGVATINSNQTLTLGGPIAATGDATFGSTADLVLLATIGAPNVNLNAGAAGIAQSAGQITTPGTLTLGTTGPVTQPGGAITAGTLAGTAGSVALTAAGNQIANLGTFTTTNNFALTDARGLTVTGVVDPGDVTLTINGDLAINNSVTAATLNLAVTGNVTEAAGGSVVATTLRGSAATLNLGGTNSVGTLADFAAGTTFALTNGTALAVTGPLTAGTSIALGSAGPMTLSGTVTAPTVGLTATRTLRPAAPGSITQTAGTITANTGLTLTAADAVSQTGGTISAGTLTGTSGGTTALNQAANTIGTLAAYSSTGGFSLRDGQSLSQTGALADTASIGLNVTGALALNGTLNAPTVNLVTTGALTQPTGAITATTLTGNTGAATLNSATNAITNLGAFTAANTFSLTDASTLNVTGAVQTTGTAPTLSLASNTIALQNGGSLTALGGTVSLAPATPGNAFSLSSLVAGGATSAITADTLQIGSATTGPITVDGAFNLTGANTLRFVSAGAVTETAAGAITANTLTGTAASFAFGGANRITTLGGVTTTGAFALTNAQALGVTGPVAGGTSVRLDVTGALALAGAVTGPTVTLNATGAITQTAGAITATTLTGTAASATLGAANQVTNLGAFTTTGAFALTDARALTTTGAVAAGGTASLVTTGDLTLNSLVSGTTVTLNSTAAITEGAGGGITATTLRGTAASATLNQTNTVATLADFATTGAFTLTDATALTVAGPLTAGTSAALTSTGPLTLSGTVTAPTLTLTARTPVGTGGGNGSITQTAGAVTAATLTGTSGGTTALNQAANAIGTLAAYSSTGGFSLRDGQSLSQTGALADTASIALNVTGALALNGTLNAPTVNLVTTGALTQPAGAITATTLTGNTGAAILNSATNAITNLGAFTAANTFSLTDASPLNITGAVQTTGTAPTLSLASNTIALQAGGSLTALGGTVSLAPATPGNAFSLSSLVAGGATSAITADTLQIGSATTGPITVDGAFNLTGANTLRFVSAGAVTETAAGAITANTLTGTAASFAFGGANRITTLGSVTTTGAFALTNAQALGVTGPVAGGTSIRLDITGALGLAGNLGAPTVTLNATGAITQTAGAITATTLTGTADSASFTAIGNQVANLGPFTVNGDFALTDARSLVIAGAVDPGDVTLTVTGDLAINDTVTANTLNLAVTGNVTEGAAGSVIATTLRGTAATLRLDQTNTITTLADFTSIGSFRLVDATPLTVTGPVVDGAAIALTSNGPLTLSGTLTAPTIDLTALRTLRPAAPGSITQTAGAITAGTGLTLTAAGTVSQSGGSIVAGQLRGSSGGTTTLNQATNLIGTLAAYSSTGGFSLRDGQSLSQTGALADTASIALNVTGALALNGTLNAPTVNLVTTGALTQPGGAITATALTGATGAASLNSATNAITNLGAFTAASTFSLTDASTLNVTGAVQTTGTAPTLSLASNSIALQSGGSLTATGGTVSLAPATPGNAFSLNSFIPAGTVSAVTADTLQVGNAAAGAITVAGPFNLAKVGTLNLVSGSTITEAAGASITVPRLTATGTTINLGGANAIGTLGTTTASGALTLVDTTPLLIAGAVNAGGPVVISAGLTPSTDGITFGTTALAGTLTTPGAVTLTTTGAITEPNGGITAASLTGSAYGATLTGTNTIPVLAGFTVNNVSTSTTNGFALTDQGPLAVTGPLVGGTAATLQSTGAMTLGANVSAGTVSLTAPTLTQTAGTITANTLNLATAGASLAGAIGALGTVQVPGTLQLTDSTGLIISGATTVGTLDLTGTGLLITGALAANTVRINLSDVLLQNGGSVQIGTLTGKAGRAGISIGDIQSGSGPRPTASVGTITDLTSGGSLTLLDRIPLTVTGTIQGVQIDLKAPGLVTLQNSNFVTNGLAIDATGAGSRIVQTGSTVVTPLTQTTGLLGLTVHGGTIALNNLVAPNVLTILAMNTGIATGSLTVGNLLVFDQGGSAALSGTVAGKTGFDAAYVSQITRFDPAYTINNCAIASITCVPIVPPPVTPVAPPVTPQTPIAPIVRLVEPTTIRPDYVLVQSVLRPDLFTADLIALDLARNPTDPDFALPNISDRDY